MAVLCGEWLSNLVVPRPATATDFSRTSPLFLPEQEGRLSSLAVKAVSSGETSKILVRDAFVSANQKENISIYPEELFKANRYIIFCSFTLLNQSASTYCWVIGEIATEWLRKSSGKTTQNMLVINKVIG